MVFWVADNTVNYTITTADYANISVIHTNPAMANIGIATAGN